MKRVEEEEEIYWRYVEDVLKVKIELRIIDIEREMILEILEKKYNRLKEEIIKEILNKRKIVFKVLRMEIEYLKKEFELVEVLFEDDYVMMVVKFWLLW